MKILKNIFHSTQSTILILGIFFSILAGFVAAYYYLIFLPAQERETAAAEFRHQEKCNESGRKAYEQDLKSYRLADSLMEPSYTFNKELNTCLYSGGYRKGNYWERWVKDSFTNENILFASNLGIESRGIESLFDDEPKEESEMEKNARKKIEQFWNEHERLFRK